jgi:hypothetical protein
MAAGKDRRRRLVEKRAYMSIAAPEMAVIVDLA